MLIKEVSKICELTKKAVEYYEKQGLIHPQVSENGYRNYSDKDIFLLKEISLLRKLGLSISDIKSILVSNNKAAALSKYKFLMELKSQKTAAQLQGIDHLIHNYDIHKEAEYIHSNVDAYFTVKEKLIQAFPGTYGMYLCIHFAPFLNEKIDNPEKETAYHKIVDYLDRLDPLEISAELKEYLESSFAMIDKTEMEKMDSAFTHGLDNIEGYIENNKEYLEEYLKIRTSPEFKNAPAYKMQQLLLAFQQYSGYDDIFIPNLKILSPSYREYSEKLQQANKQFIEQYPQAKDLYP